MAANKVKKANVPALRFKGFEVVWDKKKLGKVAEKINSGKTPLGGESTYVSQGIPFIRSQNVNNDRLEFETFTFISEDVNTEMKNSIVRSNDILLNITGASLGRSCVAPNDFNIGNVNQHVCIIRLNEGYNPRFTQPILSSNKGQRVLQSLQTGSGREGLNFESIKGIEICFPSRKEQDKIASFLSLIDERIATQSKIIKELKLLSDALINKLFIQEIRFKDNNGNCFPKWVKKKLGEVAEIKGGKRIPKGYALESDNNGFPYITVTDMKHNSVSLDNIRYVPLAVKNTIKNYTISTKDIYISVAGTLGLIGIIPPALEGANLTENANKLTNLKCNQFYLLQFLNSDALKKLIENTGTKGAQPKLAIYAIASLEVPVPSEIEQAKIANFISSIDEKIKTEKKVLLQYELQKKYLLTNLFI